MADKSYIGKGKVYLDGRFVGNVTEFTYGATEDKKELKDYTSQGGGNYNAVSRIDAVTASITMSDYSAENLSLALFGTTNSVTATTVTDESITAPATLDRLVETADIIDTTQTVTVTSDPAGTTHVVDVDYTVSAAGIFIIAGGGISASDPLLVSYTKKAVDVIEALTASSQEHELLFDGLNEAQSGEPSVIKVHRMKFSPADGISAISDDFGAITLTGDALKDTSITAGGLSQYLKISQA